MIAIILYCVIIYLLAGVGTSMGYHRVLTHKSAVLPKWFEYTIVLLGMPAGTPIQWVGTHRAHHGFTDQKQDPHSPHNKGFWHAHCGWYINSSNTLLCILYAFSGPLRMVFDAFWRPQTNLEHNHLASDIANDRFYRAISKPIVYGFVLSMYACALLVITTLILGISGIAVLWLMLVIVYNLGDGVDSFGHLYGEKLSRSEARNNTILGWLSFGDGWHANHHNNPTLAKHGIKKSQFDLTFVLLKGFRGIGLVKKIEIYEGE